jgi:hypothetical protein
MQFGHIQAAHTQRIIYDGSESNRYVAVAALNQTLAQCKHRKPVLQSHILSTKGRSDFRQPLEVGPPSGIGFRQPFEVMLRSTAAGPAVAFTAETIPTLAAITLVAPERQQRPGGVRLSPAGARHIGLAADASELLPTPGLRMSTFSNSLHTYAVRTVRKLTTV